MSELCYHPELVPTRWNQPKPEPAEMVKCECGENATCPVCHWGRGSWPCTCMREEFKLWQQLGADAFWKFEQSLAERDEEPTDGA